MKLLLETARSSLLYCTKLSKGNAFLFDMVRGPLPVVDNCTTEREGKQVCDSKSVLTLEN